jgi:hypothetical protein
VRAKDPRAVALLVAHVVGIDGLQVHDLALGQVRGPRRPRALRTWLLAHLARLRSAGHCAQFTRTVVSEYGARVIANDELDTRVAVCAIDELFSP